MLMLTPEAMEMHRALKRRERDARRGKMAAVRVDRLTDAMAAQMRAAFTEGHAASLFAFEGPFRHAIRSGLCLQGWKWAAADEMAAAMVAEALRKAGAKRPSWNEGQPEWTIESGTLIERTRCQRCHKPLPEDHHKFCSDLCRTSHHAALWRLREADGESAVTMAVRSNL
ncbi:hypothetical protein BV509_09130 [Rhodovulum sulfidophilum]|uniref:Uncharacterized protein n=1 Tax=Rhodovulum visakhapatnamense TaxID=364297 RepID=A0ABS1RJJ1_9RHOB|nr:hypothetical protein [Rhodovulum visakhapatnamense]MBL3568872.1 hypothetical protein [Rhodovulum visakhapatnamense]MBL3579793.1 hypothetical protein [Rhodovulum visakhapatnamense]OLS44486.1 hypothetical protein BV509_09130 [Rhodovulum sulfidophilum]